MSFDASGSILGKFSGDFSVRAFSLAHDRVSASISAALTETKKWNQRDCPLKPTLVLWLVLFLSIYRDLSIPAVFDVLLDFLREREPTIGLKAVTPEALCHAKGRLGSEPLKLVFRDLSSSLSPRIETFRGHRKLAVDGTYFRVADTPSNVKSFGKKKGRTEAAYPQMLAVILVETSTHRALDVELGHCHVGERSLTTELVARSLGTADLVIFDRGLPSFEIFLECQAVDSRYLARISKVWSPEIVKDLGPGDQLVSVSACSVERKRLRAIGQDPNQSLMLRMITYCVPGGETVRLLTDLMEPRVYPAIELARLYHERWEAELVFDEIKTHFLKPPSGGQPTHFRSKTPDGVYQEAYGALIAYNLVRDLMVRAAEAHSVPPLSLSFVGTLGVLKIWLPRLERGTGAGMSLAALLSDISRCRLRARRQRQCPRVVKVKMTKFKKKRPSDREKRPSNLTPQLGNVA